MRVTAVGVLLLAFAGTDPAQDLDHFEVASIRPAAPTPAPSGAPPWAVLVFPPDGGIGTSDPSRITYKATWLNNVIIEAYDLRSFQLEGPAWLGQQRYDITAKIPAAATKQQFNVMLQNLLKERFNLSFHRESKMFQVYALTVGKNGLKLKESAIAAEPTPGARIGTDKDGFPALPPGYSGVFGIPSNGRMHLAGRRAGISKLTSSLERSLGYPIVDETGLTGEYDFKLEFEWAGRPGIPADDASDPAPSVFSAVEKLGLKLTAKKVPFEVLVIDRLDKVPTAN